MRWMPYIWLVLTTGPNGREHRIGLFKLPVFYSDFPFSAPVCVSVKLQGASYQR
jgi:hypothetical protein